MDNPKPSLESVRGIVEQIAQGLQALHRRDAPPGSAPRENVMIDAQGTVKLIDLANAHVEGLAEYHRDALVAACPAPCNTPRPEYLLGEGGSQRSELFSLAAITYQLLTRTAALRAGGHPRAQPGRPAPLRYVPARHLRPDLPAWVDAVLAKALSPSRTSGRR